MNSFAVNGEHGVIAGIEYHLPDAVRTTEELSRTFPEWAVERIDEKTGIRERHVAGQDECASDLAVCAARKLFAAGVCGARDVDFILLCTQSPDYVLPTTACLLQHRLGIPSEAGALDFNLGCSGYVYGLGLAEGLIVSGQAKRVLLITAETYTKYIGREDKTCLTIFGDAAAATLIAARVQASPAIGPFVYGTDGGGGDYLVVRDSGARHVAAAVPSQAPQPARLTMNGSRIFDFTLNEVPKTIRTLLAKSRLSMNDVDVFVFHQANAYILEQLRRILEIPTAKFHIAIRHCGNTVSSTIPIALKAAQDQGLLAPGSCVMLVGFGVGLSWGATIVRWAD